MNHSHASLAALIVPLMVSSCGGDGIQTPGPVEATMRGTRCHQEKGVFGPSLVCNYRVGRELEFTIIEVGGKLATLTIQKAVETGDFRLSFSRMHDCLVIERGLGQPEGRDFPDNAFVSLQSGRVYTDWGECGRSYQSRPAKP